ncbi:MAG: AMP-binding protein [Pseudonocardiaceae bacterium]|nr:AMP-binding protein [Pseudonocardiaceae bacterium]
MSIDVTSLYNRRANQRWDRVAVGDMLERLTWSRPDQEALVGWHGAYSDPAYQRLTYRSANDIANRVANGLLSAGLQRGDRVLLYCENSVEAFLVKMAVAKAGLVSAPVNPALAPDVVTYLIDLVEPRFAVVDAELWPRAEPAFSAAGIEPSVTIPIGGDAAPGSVSFTEFLDGQSADEPDVEIHGDDIWEILFTSGTTAMPKGVMLSHTYAHMGAYSFALSLTRGLRIEADLRLCSFLPLIYHVADHPFGLPPMLCGGSLVIGRRPVAEEVAQAITRERVTALWGGSPQLVKTVTQTLLSDRMAHDASSLTVIVYGWGALEPGTAATLKQLCGEDLVLVGIFGQTEAISCHRFWPDVWLEKYRRTAPEVNYVGIPNPMLAANVVDAEGRSLWGEPDVAGEAVYRSPAVTAGYYRDEAATREVFRDGWFHSGDSCVYDEDGLRIMVDRFKDIIKSGGENVSSLRVEAVLHQHPDVAKAAVIGLAHDRWGEAVTAVVVPEPDHKPDEDDVIEFCRARLAGFETPKSVVTVDALPETVGGKVLKYKLREQLASHFDG